MKINYFLEYLFIGALYLIPYFVVHYTVVCYRQKKKMGLIESLMLAFKKLPGFLKGNISLEMKNPKTSVILFLFFLIVVGIISNGVFHHSDEFWLEGLKKIIPNTYESNIIKDQYVKNIEAIFKYDKKECSELLGRIRFQIILTRHGIVHSIIHLICLIFIWACNRLTLIAKSVWTVTILIAFFQAANGFLAANGWYTGVLNTILSI